MSSFQGNRTMITIEEIMRRRKNSLCPYCGKEGKPFLFTMRCKEHGEYGDSTYLSAIEIIVKEGNEGKQ